MLRKIDSLAPLKDWDISARVESTVTMLIDPAPKAAHHYEEDDLFVVRWIRKKIQAAERLDDKLEGHLPLG